MTGTYSFLIKAKPPLVQLLEGADEFFRYLAKDVILTAQIGDRHGFEFTTLFEQIKASYLAAVKKSLPHIDTELGFDHYWTFEPCRTRIDSLSEILRCAELTESNTPCDALNYLIQKNVESYDD